METSILTTKGQLLIPRRIRNKYGIKAGIKITFLETPQKMVIKPMDAAYLKALPTYIKILFRLPKNTGNGKKKK